METSLLIIAIAAFCIQTLTMVGGFYLANSNAIRAQNASEKAQEATEGARIAALDAAKAIVDSVSVNNARDETLFHIAEVGDTTHKIVNSQRTAMLRLIATLMRRISDDNPDDEGYRRSAEDAEKEAEEAGARTSPVV